MQDIYVLKSGESVPAKIERMFETHGPYMIEGQRLDFLSKVNILADSTNSATETTTNSKEIQHTQITAELMFQGGNPIHAVIRSIETLSWLLSFVGQPALTDKELEIEKTKAAVNKIKERERLNNLQKSTNEQAVSPKLTKINKDTSKKTNSFFIKIAYLASIVTILFVIYVVFAYYLKEQQINVARNPILETLIDPMSAQFRNEKIGFDNSIVCGEINAKNSLGGYTGFKVYMSDGHDFLMKGEDFNRWGISMLEKTGHAVSEDEKKALLPLQNYYGNDLKKKIEEEVRNSPEVKQVTEAIRLTTFDILYFSLCFSPKEKIPIEKVLN
ncbi:hypothetical protein MTYM_01408 [Methylococcales bacterium]|nr:hypothetical protein MTYM_01408 [Methylococcales bacterium]